MCGIAGVVAKRAGAVPDVVRRMTAVMHHRGPDDEGYLQEGGAALGMRRLSIIDIAGGHQPIYNEDGTVGVVLNGQIYNYRELRDELLRKGHRLKTLSDTEVIAHMYEDLGEACIDQFNGMFAFAVWDTRTRRLLLARDRLGVKPLYYYEDGERLAFASEVKALLQCPFVPREPDPDVVADYLALMYIRGPRTPFKRVRKLLPGHYLVLDCTSETARVVRYWELEHVQPARMSKEDAIAQVRDLLRDSIRLRLRSDVPVGAFLSGGIDSSSVVAFAAPQLDRPLTTFAVGFTGSQFDELRYARLVARAFGTDHHETMVSVDDAIRRLPQLVWHLDEPNADSAVVPTYLVSQFAASQLKVILSGLGGDELFGGYPRYFDGHPLEHVYRLLPRAIRSTLAQRLFARADSTLAQRLRWNALGADERYVAQVSTIRPDERSGLLPEGTGREVALREEFARCRSSEIASRRMYVDSLTYLPDDILHLTDRMSMAVSLEARTPFLDYRLVEFASALPAHFKVRPFSRQWKVLLKAALAPDLPPQILMRGKWGFGGPVLHWMNGGLLPVLRNVMRDSVAVREGLLSQAGVSQTLAAFGDRVATSHDAMIAWTLLVLEVWARVFLDHPPATSPPAFTLADLA